MILYDLLHQLSLTEINDQLFDAGEDGSCTAEKLQDLSSPFSLRL